MLELKHISFDVEDDGKGKEIIRDISLTIPDGKLVVITGPNGGGKSTLARLIMGIEQPTSGTILLNGEDITRRSITDRARLGIGFAFQQPVRFKGITVRDMLNMAAGKTLTEEELASVLQEVGLEAGEYVDRGVGTHLSGGEIKRIEIATVLARGAKLSVFDEPEAGIDLWSFQNLIEVFRGMRANIADSSILIISHQERILNIADEIIVLRDGEVCRQGAREEILPELTGTAAAARGCRKAL